MHFQRTIPLAAAAVLVPLLAQAHISVKSAPSTALVSDVVVLGVGHGCEDGEMHLDTTSVTIEIPAGVTSVRPELSGFDTVGLETDSSGAVVAVTWSKDKALPDDIAYYELRLRMKAPDAPFTQLKFPTYQHCTSPDGSVEVTTDWVGDEGDTDVSPAPLLTILPARLPGWNKYTVDKKIDALDVFFADAHIVWQGESAYSSNPTTTELIVGTEGVSSLERIKADKEFWVKF
jgi:uncharacterized protein YcnI